MSNWIKKKVCKKYVTTSRGQRICASYGQGYSLKRPKKQYKPAKKYVRSGGWFVNIIQSFRKKYSS